MQLWHVVFTAHLFAATTAALLMRRYTTNTKLHPLVGGIATNALIGIPYALIYVVVTGDFVWPSLSIGLLFIIEAMVGTIYGYLGQMAQRHTDAGSYATLSRLSIVPTVIMASVFLGESLSWSQLLGGSLLVASGLLLGKRVTKRGLGYILAGLIIVSIVIVLSRYLITETSVGTYLIISTVLGLINKLVIKGRDLPENWHLIKDDFKNRSLISICVMSHVLLFNTAVDMAGNVSSLSSLAGLKVVTTTLAAALFLGERDSLKIKLIAAVIAIVGIFIM